MIDGLCFNCNKPKLFCTCAMVNHHVVNSSGTTMVKKEPVIDIPREMYKAGWEAGKQFMIEKFINLVQTLPGRRISVTTLIRMIEEANK